MSEEGHCERGGSGAGHGGQERGEEENGDEIEGREKTVKRRSSGSPLGSKGLDQWKKWSHSARELGLSLPSNRRVVRRVIDPENCPPPEELERWADRTGVTLGPLVPPGYRNLLLCGLWT